MPTPTLRTPGVYVVEEPSGVRTITPVATSITAFVGRALRGPTDRPVTVHSWADVERAFGGLWLESSLGYSLRDFFRLGGSSAVVVRAFESTDADASPDLDVARFSTADDPAAPGTADLAFVASSRGAWGANLDVSVEDHALTADPADGSTLVNVVVQEHAPGQPTVVVRREVHRNVSWDPTSSRRVDRVLDNESALLRLDGNLPTAAPATKAAAHVDGSGTDGKQLTATTVEAALALLDQAELVNLLVVPPYTKGDTDAGVLVTETGVEASTVTAMVEYATRRDAMAILDPPADWDVSDAVDDQGDVAPNERNAALYFPRIRQPDPLRPGQIGTFAPSGAVAGIIARTDATRGVWKAPAGLDASIGGVTELSVPLTDPQIGDLNVLGVNCLRKAPAAGHVIWGARTRQGNDVLASEWKYLPVRRTALFLKVSLFRGTQWVVFEPNDEPLWAQIRLNVGAFMDTLFRQGAFAGTTPKDAYFVKCDRETTTPDDVNLGVVNIWVGFAPLKPAEFVVIHLQQMAGQAGGA